MCIRCNYINGNSDATDGRHGGCRVMRSFRAELLFFYLLLFTDLCVVLLLLCLLSLAPFIFRFPLICRERAPSIFSRNKSSPSPGESATRAILQAHKYYHHPLSSPFRFTSHFPRIPRDLSGSVYVSFPSLMSLHVRDRVSARFFFSRLTTSGHRLYVGVSCNICLSRLLFISRYLRVSLRKYRNHKDCR